MATYDGRISRHKKNSLISSTTNSPRSQINPVKINPVEKRVSDNLSSDQVYARRVHPPPISKSTLNSTISPTTISKNVLLMPNQVAPIPTSIRYNDLYSSESEDDPVFEEMVSNYKTVNSINTYSIVPQLLTLASTPNIVIKKQRNTRCRTHLATIKRVNYNTAVSATFILTALHSVSQAITRAHTDNIDLYNNTETACCADLGSPEDMLPDYSTFKTYHHLSNRYATLGDTARLPI